VKLNKVSERVYANWDGETGGNVGLVELGEESLVVDAQYPGSAKRFREAIQRATDKPPTHLLLTHIHGDHVFGAQVFKDLEIVSHTRLREKMEENLGGDWSPQRLQEMLETYRRDAPERLWLMEGLEITLPTTTFQDRWSYQGVEMIHMPGHTDCSSVVHIPEEGVVFAGDLLFVGRFPWGGDPTANPDQWIESFKRILDLEAEHIIPGHGPPCTNEEVEKQMAWMREVKWIMKGLIEEGATLEEAVSHPYRELYPCDRPEWQKRTYAHWFNHWSQH